DGYRPSCLRSDGPGPAVRRVGRGELGGGKGRGMNGAHRQGGIFVLAGEGGRPGGGLPAAAIVGVMPTPLPCAGLPVPEGLDGRPITGALVGGTRFEPDRIVLAPRAIDAAETGEMATRLAALGYLEPQ